MARKRKQNKAIGSSPTGHIPAVDKAYEAYDKARKAFDKQSDRVYYKATIPKNKVTLKEFRKYYEALTIDCDINNLNELYKAVDEHVATEELSPREKERADAGHVKGRHYYIYYLAFCFQKMTADEQYAMGQQELLLLCNEIQKTREYYQSTDYLSSSDGKKEGRASLDGLDEPQILIYLRLFKHTNDFQYLINILELPAGLEGAVLEEVQTFVGENKIELIKSLKNFFSKSSSDNESQLFIFTTLFMKFSPTLFTVEDMQNIFKEEQKTQLRKVFKAGVIGELNKTERHSFKKTIEGLHDQQVKADEKAEILIAFPSEVAMEACGAQRGKEKSKLEGHSPVRFLWALHALLEAFTTQKVRFKVSPSSDKRSPPSSPLLKDIKERLAFLRECGLEEFPLLIDKVGDTLADSTTLTVVEETAKHALELTEQLLSESSSVQFALNIGTPGHHSTDKEASGFCMMNNIACCARAAHAGDRTRKIAVIDIDVHRGDGTQELLKSKKNNHPVQMIDVFAKKLFGDTQPDDQENPKNIHAVGVESEGSEPPGDKEFIKGFDKAHASLVAAFDNQSPDIIFVSLGLDSCEGDPLGQCKTTPDYFRHVIETLRNAHPKAKIALLLEGGYEESEFCFVLPAVIEELRKPLIPKTAPTVDCAYDISDAAASTPDSAITAVSVTPTSSASVQSAFFKLATSGSEESEDIAMTTDSISGGSKRPQPDASTVSSQSPKRARYAT